jgi:putative transposase
VVKDLLEEVAAAEREAFCEQNEDVCNGYYSRGLDGMFGKIDVRVPRTRARAFRPFFLEPYKRTSYELEELVVAMYQGSCSTRDISRTVGALIDGKYSVSWVSRITDVVRKRSKQVSKKLSMSSRRDDTRCIRRSRNPGR